MFRARCSTVVKELAQDARGVEAHLRRVDQRTQSGWHGELGAEALADVLNLAK